MTVGARDAVRVHRFRVYDILSDDYCTSTRMATAEKIAKIGGEIIPGTAYTVDANGLDDGWTEKNYTHILEQAAIDVIKRSSAFLNFIDEARCFVSNVKRRYDER